MIQTICEKAGKYACLAFCYLHMIGIDPIKAIVHYKDWLKQGLIDDDYYVKDGNKLINWFNGGVTKRKVVFVDEKDLDKDTEYITKFYNEKTKLSHFVVTKGRDVVTFDSLSSSITVRDGKPIQWRRVL